MSRPECRELNERLSELLEEELREAMPPSERERLLKDELLELLSVEERGEAVRPE